MAAKPKHRDISGQLRNEISQGQYGPTGRLPSEAQLVERFQVSRPTVARALRDLQQGGLIERRAGAGTFVRSDAPAASAAGTRQLGLLIPGLGSTEIFEVICGELASLARVQDYNLLWGGGVHPRLNADASVEEAQEVCRRFIQAQGGRRLLCPVRTHRGQGDRESATGRESASSGNRRDLAGP